MANWRGSHRSSYEQGNVIIKEGATLLYLYLKEVGLLTRTGKKEIWGDIIYYQSR